MNRKFLHPRRGRIRRVAGTPNARGCTIEFQVVPPHFSFRLVLEQWVQDHLAVNCVQNGFARGGVLIFELEARAANTCDLSIYVACNFPRGRNVLSGLAWWLMRHGFAAFVHDVIWNHSLCQLKDCVEIAWARSFLPSPGPLPYQSVRKISAPSPSWRVGRTDGSGVWAEEHQVSLSSHEDL